MRTSARSHARDGFALPTVIITLAVITLVYLVAITAVQSLQREVRIERDEVDFQRRALTLEAEVAFMLATEPTSTRALEIGRRRYKDEETFGQSDESRAEEATRTDENRVYLDGRPYRALAEDRPLVVSLQDEAGLIDLNQLDRDGWIRLAQRLGTPEALRNGLADRVNDYRDADDLRRVAGAEADDYRRAGLDPPLNRSLGSLDELGGVLDWRQSVTPLAERQLRAIAAVDPTTAAVNVNTAPAEALEVMYDLTPQQAALAVARRKLRFFFSASEMGASVGKLIDVNAETFTAAPNGRLALSIVDPRKRLLYTVRIAVTPADRFQPLWYSGARQRPLDQFDKEPPAAPEPLPRSGD